MLRSLYSYKSKIIPSALNQCLKFMVNGLEYCIKGNIKPFILHKVGIYEDATYYLSKSQNFFSPNEIKENKKKKLQKQKKYKKKWRNL